MILLYLNITLGIICTKLFQIQFFGEWDECETGGLWRPGVRERLRDAGPQILGVRERVRDGGPLTPEVRERLRDGGPGGA